MAYLGESQLSYSRIDTKFFQFSIQMLDLKDKSPQKDEMKNIFLLSVIIGLFACTSSPKKPEITVRKATPPLTLDSVWRSTSATSDQVTQFTIVQEVTKGGKRDLKLVWDSNKESNIAGYRVYLGKESGKYHQFVDVDPRKTPKNEIELRIKNLPAGEKYFVAVTAIDTNGNESNYSGEASKEIPVMVHQEYVPPKKLKMNR